MLTYQPPKSSIWGHRLGKMPARRARALLAEFLAKAVGSYEVGPGSFRVMGDVADSPLSPLVATLGAVNRTLTMEQSDQCIEAIARWEEGAAEERAPVNLIQAFEVLEWRIDARLVPTRSRLFMYYGFQACLSTFLEFDGPDSFEHIRKIFADLGLCKLNPKHLKTRR